MNSSHDKMIILTIVEDQNLYLNYWEKGETVINRPLASCCSKVAASMSLELSHDEKTVFVAGCDKMDITEGRPIISAISFDGRLKQKTYMLLSDAKLRNIFKLKRLKTTSEDILLAGGFNGISIICFNSHMGVFQELKTLGGLHDGEIFDFYLHDNVIYSIAGKDSYIHKY